MLDRAMSGVLLNQSLRCVAGKLTLYAGLLFFCCIAVAHQSASHIMPDPRKVPDKPVESLLEDISLFNQDGLVFSLTDLKGRPVLLNFMFTNCIEVCGIQTQQLKHLQEQLSSIATAHRPVFVSISLDTENDTSDVLLEYARRFSVQLDSWHFASGEKNSIDELATALWVGQQPRDDGQIDHRMILHLLDKNLELVQRYSADPIDIDRVAAEMTILATM